MRARFSGAMPAQLGKVSVPLSGFRVRSRINSPKVWDEFLVFQGAHSRSIPVVITMGGGYSVPIDATVEAHANTFRTASTYYKIMSD